MIPAQSAWHEPAIAAQPGHLKNMRSGFERCEGRASSSSFPANDTPGNAAATSHHSVGGSSWLAAHQKRGRARRGLLWQLAVIRALVAKRVRLLYRGESLYFVL